MVNFNVAQKRMRAAAAERKRAVHGDPITGKVKNKSQPVSISGKRRRKLLKKWRRDQKECVEKGLVTMEDIEMAVAEGTPEDTSKVPKKFHLKKKHLKLNKLKHKGKNKRKSSKQDAETTVEAMVE